jgi:hypothetical protein
METDMNPIPKHLKKEPNPAARNAASRAVSIFNNWAATQAPKPKQGTLFEEYAL